jgi:predicted CXXCH cytochrome family protein
MIASKRLQHLMLISMFFILAAILIFIPHTQAQAEDQTPQPTPEQDCNETCLVCHGNPELSMTLDDGETLSLYIPEDYLQESIHNQIGIGCRSCHTTIDGYPHPEVEYSTHRELSRAFYLACRTCHADNYDKTLDSMHAQAAEAGNLEAPICTDCHGTHDIRPPDQPRSHISATCGKCHTTIFEQYKGSVHGAALIMEDNPDVPVCTDCHGVHNIQDPRTALFRIETPELCAGCHANQELMEKYGLPADVYDLYRISWHGVDVSVYKANWPSIWHESAVCTDCHGVHYILKTENPESTVNPANLLTTCQKCHPGVGKNWTGAWTGHNKVSQERTPFVYYTQAFYQAFIPAVLAVSALYVLLQIIRATVARVRRSL